VPDLTTDQLTLAIAVVGGVAVIALLLVLVLYLKLRRLRRAYMIVRGESRDRDIMGTLAGWSRELDEVMRRVDAVSADQERLADIGRLAIQRFHLVRYDAFEDMGGRLSFSAALLDEHGDGLVITSINGRSETRTYAKPIKNLRSDHNLSEEEGEAIAGAVAGEGRGSRQVVSR
jgi:Protein of unknown function (DUF4446)